MKFFSWFGRKSRNEICESCRSEFQVLTKMPTVGELLDRGKDLSFIFTCESCGMTFCTRCLVPLNPGLKKAADWDGDTIGGDVNGTFLCPGCRTKKVQLHRLGMRISS